jgi:hypothetical protein
MRVQDAMHRNSDAANLQREREILWLKCRRGEDGPLAGHPFPEAVRKMTQAIEDRLAGPEIRSTLNWLGMVNGEQRHPILVSPTVFLAMRSVEARAEQLKKTPALGAPTAEVRAHLAESAKQSRKLAARLRESLQPTVWLAPPSDAHEIIQWWTRLIRNPNETAQPVPVDWVLEEAAARLDEMAKSVRRPTRNRSPQLPADKATAVALRARLIDLMTKLFLDRLGRPHHARVADLVAVFSGAETSEEDVKKAAARRRVAAMRRKTGTE